MVAVAVVVLVLVDGWMESGEFVVFVFVVVVVVVRTSRVE